MPPPPHTFQSSGDWTAVEEKLGLTLPEDYKQFIADYGYGQIGHFLSILNPFCRNPYVNLFSGSTADLDALNVLQASGEKHPYPLYPEEEGILPIGGTDNGDTLFWITRGTPDKWEIAVNESRGPEWEQFPCGLTEFLAGVLRGTIQCSIFPEDFPGDDTSFTPADGDFIP